MSGYQRSRKVEYIGLALILLSFAVMGIRVVARNLSPRHETFRVKRVAETMVDNYLVFTTDGDVYQNTDAWLYGKVDSSDLQARLSPGDCVNARVAGYRVRLLSWYPNILEASVVSCPSEEAGR